MIFFSLLIDNLTTICYNILNYVTYEVLELVNSFFSGELSNDTDSNNTDDTSLDYYYDLLIQDTVELLSNGKSAYVFTEEQIAHILPHIKKFIGGIGVIYLDDSDCFLIKRLGKF